MEAFGPEAMADCPKEERTWRQGVAPRPGARAESTGARYTRLEQLNHRVEAHVESEQVDA
jgi:hypothetical protein